MKTAYFDCSGGIAGNMILAALIDAGLPIKHLKKELQKIPLPKYILNIKKDKQGPFVGINLEVKIQEKEHSRSLKQIFEIIKKSKLKKDIEQTCIKIFEKLGQAEAKVHGESFDKVHLHDVGGTDAIIDIVGAVIGLDHFKIEQIYCSGITTGVGTLKYVHGTLPIPAPAAAELLKDLPINKSNIQKELATPTGLAIISTLTNKFNEMPKIQIKQIGYGIGTRKIKGLPPLRIIIGDSKLKTIEAALVQIETNIDDMGLKYINTTIKQLMKKGALDAWAVPIQMKKNRIGISLNILCSQDKKDLLLKELFNKTTTIGARAYLVKREKLKRTIKPVKTKYGIINMKVAKLNGKIKNVSAEFEDCRKVAVRSGAPIIQVYAEAFLNYKND